jgi:hypothetical protein
MNQAQQRSTQAAFPFGFVLFLVFLVLKLTKTIAWSWWWVTAPLWIAAIAGLALGVIKFAGWWRA